MEAVGFLAGFLTMVIFVPQTIRTIRTKKTRDLSLLTLVLLCVSASLWVVYGVYKELPAVWLTNIVVATLGVTILSIKLKNKT